MVKLSIFLAKNGYKQTPEHIRKTHAKEINKKISEALKRYYAAHSKHNSQETRRRISEGLHKYYQTHNGYWSGKKRPREVVQKQVEGRKQYYRANHAWNLGLPWPEEVRERIRQGCLDSEIGMGPKQQTAVGQERRLTLKALTHYYYYS